MKEQGVWLDVWRKFFCMLDKKGALDWQEAFIDGSFASVKKGGRCWWPTKRGKGTKWMVVGDSQGVPLGSTLASASPAEVTPLAAQMIEKLKVPRQVSIGN